MFIRKAAPILSLAAGAAALVFLYQHDPSSSHAYPRCVFHALTGWLCPGCGATRSLYHLIHGEVREAIHFNALFVMFFPILMIGGGAEAVAAWNGKVINSIRHAWIGWTIVALLIGWSVFRNL